MITGVVANALCMHTVLRVLLCYRIVLPCYRCSVTEVLNNSSGFCIGVFQFENRVYRVCDWLLAASQPFTLAPWICSRLDKPRVRAITARVRARINRRGSRRGRGRPSSRANMYSSNPNLQQVKLKKRSKKHPPLTPINTSVGEIHQLVV